MKTPADTKYPDTHHDDYSKTVFGFWVYLLTDFMMFAALIATYVVLKKGTNGGPTPRDLFNLPTTFVQTLLLLLSSFTSGLGGILAHRKKKKGTLLFFILTFILGAAFLYMEWGELSRLMEAGNSWKRSAFLSAFFTVIGTHGFHVVLGLLWILILLPPVILQGLTDVSIKRLSCLRIFWQFINVVWILLFSLIYLLGGN